MKYGFTCVMICLLFLVLGSAYANNNPLKDGKYYFFRSLAEKSEVVGGVTFYAEVMSKSKAVKKAKLWLEVQREMQRLAISCPPPQSDDDPQAFTRWQEAFFQKSDALDKLLKKFYDVHGKLEKISASGDELSIFRLIYATFGTVFQSVIVEKENLVAANNGQMEVAHCNFVRYVVIPVGI